MAHDKKEGSKGVAVLETVSNASAVALVSSTDIDFLADAEEFGANYSQEQMTTPFLNILNALSPQVTRGKAEFIKEAQVGNFFNTVTKELYDGEKGLNIILSTFKESFIEWVPRTQGGGFVHEYNIAEGSQIRTITDEHNNAIIQPGSAYGTPGNYLSLTHTRLGAIVSEDLSSWTPVVLSMSASGIKVSRNLNACHKLMEWKNPATGKPGPLGKCPMPLILWTVKTVLRTNKNNDTWFSWEFTKKNFLYELPQEDFLNLYRSIRDFSSSSRGQTIMEDAVRESMASTVSATSETLSEDIPF